MSKILKKLDKILKILDADRMSSLNSRQKDEKFTSQKFTKTYNILNFGPNLKRFRKAQNLTQTQLGRLCGLQPSAINHFETGRRIPAIKNVIKLCSALEKTMDELFRLNLEIEELD